MKEENQLEIFNDADDLSKAVGNFIVDLAKKSIAEKNKFSIVLSGGKTPEKLFSLLASSAYKHQINWQKTFVFFGDERCVPLYDERNNAFVAKTLLLDKIEIPDSNIFRIPVDLSPKDAAKHYEKTIKDFFRNEEPKFDLILLGLGENGHTASLFPMTSVINEEYSLVKEVFIEELQMFRITMTAPLINQAKNILFLLTGLGKASVLEIVLNGKHEPDNFPAQLISPTDGQIFWFMDKEAAIFIK